MTIISTAYNEILANEQTPLVSVIMPAYNAERCIADSIESVLNQSYPHWELNVIDDCSVDSTVKIVRRYCEWDSRVRLIESEENVGPAIARNMGIDASAGHYLALLDSDDLWLPEKLAEQITFMIEEGIAVSCTGYRRMNQDGSEVYKLIKAPHMITYSVLLKNTCIANLTAIISRDALGGTRFRNIGHEDFAFWLEILRKGYVVQFLDKDLARYRVLETSVSSRKLRVLGWTWFIYREREQFGVFRSLWYIGNYVARAVLKRLPVF